MGNQLAGMAPQQIHPAEFYLSELTNSELLSFDINLGSTRFFKVARVKLHQSRPQLTSASASTSNSYTGFGPPALGVAKVFVIHDPSLPIKSFKNKLDSLQETLRDNPNALPFSRVILNEKAGILLRQYIKYNLYDRLSTRPFLTLFEKKWVAFQLLKCMQWTHRQGLYHGDLKLENVLITSSLWVLVTDFACFKPVSLPDDNPSDFSFFFDTSRRRTCNVAPERFISEDIQSTGPSPSADGSDPTLTPQMDLFSLGCVIAELFSEDAPNFMLFDLSSLLSYRKYKNIQSLKLDSIVDKNIKSLILNLVDLDPSMRNSTTQHLREMTPSVFPNYFNLLFDYFKELMQLSPDGKIIRLASDVRLLIRSIVPEDSQGLLLILTVVTSCLRALKHVHAKVTALRLLCDILKADKKTLSSYILDRVLPYLMAMISDQNPRVRREAIDSLTFALHQVEEVAASDNNVFTDYILPTLNQVVSDRSVLVRMNLAANLGNLAETSYRFLSKSCQNYDSEHDILQETFQSMISHLLIDPDNAVKKTLLSTNISKLCVFLGKTKTNDVILSHIITFLNDKEDFELRFTFFDNIVPIAAYLGSQCSSILKPLLQQGLSDSEETVIYKTLLCLSSLAQLSILSKNILFELMIDAIPLLSHPNLWIRHSLVSFIITFSKHLTLAELSCKLTPHVKLHLKRDIHLLTNELILDSLKPPVPRSIYNLVISKSNSKQNIDFFFECLNERRMIRSLPRHHLTSSGSGSGSMSNKSSSLLERLEHEGLNGNIEEMLLKLGDIVKRINKSTKSMGKKVVPFDGNCYVGKKNRRLQSIQMIDHERNIYERSRSKTVGSTYMNEEWRHMFGSGVKGESATLENTLEIESLSEPTAIPIAHEARESMSIHEADIQCPPCTNDLNRLINHKKDNQQELVMWSSLDSSYSSPGSVVSSGHRPKGILIAHLHEHSKCVNRLIPIQGTSLFASCSSDGTIKTWDAAKIEGAKNPVNKANQTSPSIDSSSIEGMTFCPTFGSLIGYTNKNVVHVYRVESNSYRLRLIQTQNLSAIHDNDNLSSITDITTSSPFAFMVSFSNSTILGFDLRTTITSPSWKVAVSPRDGFITCINGSDYCVFGATSSGAIVTFDIRFGLRATKVNYAERKRIRRLLFTEHGLYSSVKNNNEVTLWDCESGSRLKTLWASRAPALSQSPAHSSPDSVLGMVSLTAKDNNSLLTCGSDMRIRYWDLSSPTRSYIISDGIKSLSNNIISQSPLPSSSAETVTYSSKFVDGIQVYQEHEKKSHSPGASPSLGSSANTGILWDQQAVSPSHKDSITDITWISPLNFLVSAGKDGVIKLWK